MNTTSKIKKEKKAKYLKSSWWFLLLFSAALIIYCMRISGKRKLIANALAPMTEDSDNNQTNEIDADLYVDGIPYKYKDSMINILLLGVDSNTSTDNSKHQADLIMLAAIDEQNKSITLLSIQGIQ